MDAGEEGSEAASVNRDTDFFLTREAEDTKTENLFISNGTTMHIE